jgi:hypothetical protein
VRPVTGPEALPDRPFGYCLGSKSEVSALCVGTYGFPGIVYEITLDPRLASRGSNDQSRNRSAPLLSCAVPQSTGHAARHAPTIQGQQDRSGRGPARASQRRCEAGAARPFNRPGAGPARRGRTLVTGAIRGATERQGARLPSSPRRFVTDLCPESVLPALDGPRLIVYIIDIADRGHQNRRETRLPGGR